MKLSLCCQSCICILVFRTFLNYSYYCLLLLGSLFLFISGCIYIPSADSLPLTKATLTKTYKRKLVEIERTEYTDIFGRARWPGAPHRVLANEGYFQLCLNFICNTQEFLKYFRVIYLGMKM